MTNYITTFNLRQNMLSPNFEIYHYKDKYLKNVAMHHHDFYEILFFLNGTAEFRVENRHYHLAPFDLLMISPWELHQMIISPDSATYERFILWISKDFLEKIQMHAGDINQCFMPSDYNPSNLLRLNEGERKYIEQMIYMLLHEFHSCLEHHQVALSSMLMTLLIYINRAIHKYGLSQTTPDAAPQHLMDEIHSYINDHIDMPLSIQELSEHFFLDSATLTDQFKLKIGITPYKYIRRKRLLLARNMLTDGINATETCFRCGFSEYSSFYRAFRQEYGVGPKEYSLSLLQNNHSIDSAQ